MPDLFIYGSGLASLSLAYFLQLKGVNFALLLPHSSVSLPDASQEVADSSVFASQPYLYGSRYYPKELFWLKEELSLRALPEMFRVFNDYDKYTFDMPNSLVELQEALSSFSPYKPEVFYKYLSERIKVLDKASKLIDEGKSLLSFYMSQSLPSSNRSHNDESMVFKMLEEHFQHRFMAAWIGLPHILGLSYLGLPGFTDIVAVRSLIEGVFQTEGVHVTPELLLLKALEDKGVEIHRNCGEIVIERIKTGLRLSTPDSRTFDAKHIILGDNPFRIVKGRGQYRYPRDLKHKGRRNVSLLVGINQDYSKQDYRKLARHNILLPINYKRFWCEDRKEDLSHPPIYIGAFSHGYKAGTESLKHDILQIVFPFLPDSHSEEEHKGMFVGIIEQVENLILKDLGANILWSRRQEYPRPSKRADFPWNPLKGFMKRDFKLKGVFLLERDLLFGQSHDMVLRIAGAKAEEIASFIR